MTVQNQLPKIIINLLFVTFSFAIAGLLIDFMWLVTYLMVNLMASIDPQISPVTIGQHLFDNPIGFFNQVIDIPGTALGVGRAFQQVLQGVLHPSDITGISSNGCGSTPFWSGVCNTWNTVSNAFQTAFGWLISWIFGIIGTVIIAIAVIVAMVRLWWALLQAYIYILLNTIIAPFTIFGGLLPGSKAGFGAWMKTMIANIAVFPTVMAVLLLGKSIMDALRNSPGFFQAPLIGQPNSISGSSAHGAIVNPLGMIVGFIILLITPKIVETVKKTIGAADFSAASGIFESIAGAQQLTGGAQKGVGSYLFSEKNDATGRMGGVVTRSLFEHEGIAKLFRRNTYK